MASQPTDTPAAADDLISFLKVLPDCRMCRHIRFPQWWMVLVAIPSVLSGEGSPVGMERFAKRHWQALNVLVGTDFGKSPCDSSFRLLLAQLNVPGFEALLREWMSAQLGVAEVFSTLVCVAPGFREAAGKTLSGSIDENTPSARKDVLSIAITSFTRGLDGGEQCVATARPSKLM